MRYIASLILACCLVSPAFAGQEFCQIANPGSCGSAVEPQISTPGASVSNANRSLARGEASQHHDAARQDNYSGYALLELGLMNIETPSTHR